MYTLKEDNSQYIVNESYFYKTEPYYAIVKNENEGIKTTPSSSDVLDAYIVLYAWRRRSWRHPGLRLDDIDYFVSLPALIYGLNYFSTPSDNFLVSDHEGRGGH